MLAAASPNLPSRLNPPLPEQPAPGTTPGAIPLTKHCTETPNMWNRATREPRAMLQKFGYAGIFFFTVKGLCWLVVPVFLAWYGS